MTPDELRDLRNAQPSWMADGKGLLGDEKPLSLRSTQEPRHSELPRGAQLRGANIDPDQTTGDPLRRDPDLIFSPFVGADVETGGESDGPIGIAICPEFTLVCDSISASKNKETCGFPEYPGYESDPPKFYRKRETAITGGYNETDNGGPAPFCSYHINISYSGWLTTLAYSDECELNDPIYAGTRTRTTNGTNTLDPGCSTSGTVVETNGGGTTGSDATCSCHDTWPDSCRLITVGAASYTATTSTQVSTMSAVSPCDTSRFTSSGSVTTTITLSDEYSTDDLKTDAEGALPSYSGAYDCDAEFEDGQGCDCAASTNLSEDESSISIERFKYKFKFTAPTDSISFDITWCERLIPTLTGDVTYDGTVYHAGDADPDPSHWTYTPKSWSYEDTSIDDSDVFECLEPGSNGTIDICCIRCCVTDPEPSSPCEESTCP